MSAPTDARRSLGRLGEDLAALLLQEGGFTIIERNWRAPARTLPGELDIIAEEWAPDMVHGGESVPWRVIVEVRTRRGAAAASRFGSALQSVDERKAARLRALAAAWVQLHGWQGPWRIDVVALQVDGAGRILDADHIVAAVQGI